MTDELCPQFGIIGAACSDPETLCDQYVFCKRARELQKEPDTLPQWAIDAIDKLYCYPEGYEAQAWNDALDKVISLRKPEDKE